MSVTADYPVPVSSYTYPRNPIICQLPNYNFFIDENAYCEFCLQTPYRNSDFYTCYLCSTEFTFLMTKKKTINISLHLVFSLKHNMTGITQVKLIRGNTPGKFASTPTSPTLQFMTYPGGIETRIHCLNAHLLCFAYFSGHLPKTL